MSALALNKAIFANGNFTSVLRIKVNPQLLKLKHFNFEGQTVYEKELCCLRDVLLHFKWPANIDAADTIQKLKIESQWSAAYDEDKFCYI